MSKVENHKSIMAELNGTLAVKLCKIHGILITCMKYQTAYNNLPTKPTASHISVKVRIREKCYDPITILVHKLDSSTHARR